jgi:ATP-binding cassette subfamily F protein uup
MVVITHDRWFLDAVCTATWEVTDGTVHQYEGGYAAYVLARAERERVAAAAAERRRNLLRKELAWLRRGPPARTSKPRFRIDAANALIADEPPPRDRVELLRFATARLGKSVYDVEDVTLEIAGRRLLQRATWRLGPGDRVALVGRNGAGKTSFLRLLHGELAPASGRVGVGATVKAATLAQEIDEVDPELRVLEALEAVRPRVDLGQGRELTASQLCERFGFGGTRQWTFVRDLSGGERRRLQLMRLLMGEPNVLLLDEPTNDLDIDTLTALEDLLDGWPGSLVVVSHDRFFVERVCDDVYGLVGDGGIRHLPGGVDTYLRLVREREAAAAPPRPQPTATTVPKGAAIREAKRAAQRLERELERLERRRSELHDALAEHATDYERVVELDRELRQAEAELGRLEEAWLDASTVADG